jgi:peptide/nickel transport system substrate-binding protein
VILRARSICAFALLLPLAACGPRSNDPTTLRFLIESSPNNLDLRQGTDAQSERIGGLIYDALVKKDTHFILQPWLATSWERPDSLTWIFHIRANVHFHDGKPLTAADVAWSIKSMINGTIISAKGGNLPITSVAVTGPLTVTVTTKQPDDSLLFNLSDGLFGIVERGAGHDEGVHPIGTGPFEFVSQMQDKDVILNRNPNYWAGAPHIQRIRFEVIPDTITAALEMRKGSADIESNVLTPDMVEALRREKNVVVQSGPGAIVMYANINTQDAKLRDPRVRQAVAYSIDRPALIASLWHGEAQLADTLLPSSHWAAAAADAELPHYPHDISRAIALLDSAGLKPDKEGIRLRFTLKTSTDETTRLVAQAMQQQMRAAGIALELRSAEFGTFYSDITRGAFQMYMLRWIGSNEDPDFLRYAFATSSFPPKGGNRGRYSNPRVDALLAQANAETDEAARRRDYIEVQQILARDLPSIPLWYPNNEVVHSTRLVGVSLDPGGTFDFLRTASLR